MAGADKHLQKERLELQRIAPAPGTAANYAVYLSMQQLYEIERMSYQGMDLEQIRRRLGIPGPLWDAMKEGNPELAKAVFGGRDRMTDEMSSTMARAGASGDITAAKFMLERFGGKQYRPPTQKVEIEPKAPPPPTIDVVESVQDAFAEQRKLFARSIGREVETEAVAGALQPADQAGAVGAGAGAVGAGAVEDNEPS